MLQLIRVEIQHSSGHDSNLKWREKSSETGKTSNYLDKINIKIHVRKTKNIIQLIETI